MFRKKRRKLFLVAEKIRKLKRAVDFEMCFLMPLQGESIAERAVAQFTFEWFDAQVHFLVLSQMSCLTEGGLTPRALVWFLSKNDKSKFNPDKVVKLKSYPV